MEQTSRLVRILGCSDSGSLLSVHFGAVARNKQKLADAEKELLKYLASSEDKGLRRVLTISADLSGQYSDVKKSIQEAIATFGDVDVLVNCAGNQN